MITRKTWQFVATRHGTYTITVEVEGPTGGVDPESITEAWEAIRPLVDHADLDAELVGAGHIPAATPDHVAEFLLGEFGGELDNGHVHVGSVTVSEGADSSVTAVAS